LVDQDILKTWNRTSVHKHTTCVVDAEYRPGSSDSHITEHTGDNTTISICANDTIGWRDASACIEHANGAASESTTDEAVKIQAVHYRSPIRAVALLIRVDNTIAAHTRRAPGALAYVEDTGHGIARERPTGETIKRGTTHYRSPIGQVALLTGLDDTIAADGERVARIAYTITVDIRLRWVRYNNTIIAVIMDAISISIGRVDNRETIMVIRACVAIVIR